MGLLFSKSEVTSFNEGPPKEKGVPVFDFCSRVRPKSTSSESSENKIVESSSIFNQIRLLLSSRDPGKLDVERETTVGDILFLGSNVPYQQKINGADDGGWKKIEETISSNERLTIRVDEKVAASSAKPSPGKIIPESNNSSKYPKIAAAPLVHTFVLNHLNEEPRHSMITEIAVRLNGKFGIPFTEAKKLAFFAHGQEWPEELRYTRFALHGIGSAVKVELTTKQIEHNDKIVDGLLKKTKGRFLGTVKEHIPHHHFGHVKNDIIFVDPSDNNEDVASKMKGQCFIVLLRHPEDHHDHTPNFKYADGHEAPVEKKKLSISIPPLFKKSAASPHSASVSPAVFTPSPRDKVISPAPRDTASGREQEGSSWPSKRR